MATSPSPFPAFPSATTYPPPLCGCYYPPSFPYATCLVGAPAPSPSPGGCCSAPPTFPNSLPASAYTAATVPAYYPLAPAIPYPIPTQINHHFPPTTVHHPVQGNPQTNAAAGVSPGQLVSRANNIPDHSFIRLQATNTPSASGFSLSLAPTASTPLSSVTPSSGSTTAASTTSSLFSAGPSMLYVSASNRSSPATYVAPQVFGEMPTPRSCPRKFSSPLHYYQEQGDPIQSTSVPEGTNNLSEQNLVEMTQSYGFSNLHRRSILLADGNERSYYALPENYPLEQATPSTSPSAAEKVGFTAPQFVAAAGLAPSLCSNVNAEAGSDLMLVNNLQLPLTVPDTPNVCKKMPVYDVYGDEQQESEQPPKCSNEQAKNPLAEVVSEFAVTDNVDVSVARYIKYKHGQCIPQVLEYSYTPGGAMGDVLLKEYKWNMLLSEEGREIWDPGASVSLPSSKAKLPGELSYVAMVISKVLNLCNQVGTYVQQLRDPSWNVLLVPERREEWDPGDTEIHDLYPVAAGGSKMQCAYVYRDKLQWDPGIAIFHLLIFICQQVDLKQFWCQLSLQRHSCRVKSTAVCKSTATTLCMRVVLCSGNIAQEGRHEAVLYQVLQNQLPMSKISYIWDPGTKHNGLYVHMIQLVGSSAIHACYLPSALLPPTHIVAYGSSNSKAGELTSRCLIFHLQQINNRTSTISHGITSYAYTMDFINDQLEFIRQRGVNENYKTKSLLISSEILPVIASYVWDPGTVLLLSKSIWLLPVIEEKVMSGLIPEQWSSWCIAMHYCKIFQRCAAISSLFHCHGIPLWLINFQVP